MKASVVSRTLIAALFGIAGASLLTAQSYLGGIRGSIQDSGGAVIVNAKVTLIDEAKQTSRSTISSAQGEYVFSQVDPATYTVNVEAPGFKNLKEKGIIVATQQFLTVDLKLEVGEVTTSVQAVSYTHLTLPTKA